MTDIADDSANTAYTSQLLSRPGAMAAQDEAVDHRGVAWHYGNPLVEQRPLDDGGAIIDRSHRGVIKVHGPDAATFLHNLLSQKLDDVPVGYYGEALDLDMNGRILHHASVARTAAETFYLHVPSYDVASFHDFLTRMVFWSKVEVTTSNLGVLTMIAPADAPAIALPVPDAIDLGRSEHGEHDLLIPRLHLEDAVDAIQRNTNLSLAGLMAFTAFRVRNLLPERAIDLDNKSIPHEVTDWIGRPGLGRQGAVHLDKGCYRGQETVARVENLGRSPRVLLRVLLDGSVPQLPTPHTDITASGRKIGRLGTIVHDYELGPIALATIKRSALTNPPPTLQAGDCAIAIDTDSLPPKQGPQAGREAIKKLRQR